MKWGELSTAALLPERIRKQFQLRYGWAEKTFFYLSFGLVRYENAFIAA